MYSEKLVNHLFCKKFYAEVLFVILCHKYLGLPLCKNFL